ncbi:DNA mismatch repair protein MutS [Dehalococcoidia bacterium]|nr:DNA mismatch repair protein MutS [Dehalococcoidia bacterium]
MTTPIRRQYLRIKGHHQDAILLFRMGDFYETFDDDAKIAAQELDITLTSREFGHGDRHPLAGIPHHTLETHLVRLIKKGYKVAICEQISDPSMSKGLVDRAVVRVVTPGTVIETSILEERTNNYLVSVAIEGDMVGLAYIDISTSTLASVTQMALTSLPSELQRLSPAEVIIATGQEFFLPESYPITNLDASLFRLESARTLLLEHLGTSTLKGYGCDHLALAIRSAGALLSYLGSNQPGAISHITGITTYNLDGVMVLDQHTIRNLELFSGGRRDASNNSLLSVLDSTKTSMGARLLRRWLGQPLLNVTDIKRRQECVGWFVHDTRRRQNALQILGRIADIERLVNRIQGINPSPRDLIALRSSLEALPDLHNLLLEGQGSPAVNSLPNRLPLCQETTLLIKQAIEDEPGQVGDGAVVRVGFSPALDDLRRTTKDTRGDIVRLEGQERERTGIKNLKVGYNRVFGYFIEVTKSNISKVPPDYQRRQTLTNGERFITKELKEYESLVLNAGQQIDDLETSLFHQICQDITNFTPIMLEAAETIAQIDVFAVLAEAAHRYNYVQPDITEGLHIEITDGRHPMVERKLPPGVFVPNDTAISGNNEHLVILTGPNMSGKSTYIRQVALIVLMAQIGSFVPARAATIGITDRIFTRVGLQDDLATGQSTFMVEMVETAAILNNATTRSLIILDEIGRGTSTYDGLSIAQAVTEHIHNNPYLRCRTLFATHYHELTDMAKTLSGVRNYSVAATEEEGTVVFLHRVIPGGADRSYGVHVAKLAGLPRGVVSRAWEILADLEGNRQHGLADASYTSSSQQLELFVNVSEVLQELLELNVPMMTPIEAITNLYSLQQKAIAENNYRP